MWGTHTVNLALKTYSAATALPFFAHPHMLRHACDFALADQGRIRGSFRIISGIETFRHTVRYTVANPARFEKRWR
jgi:hypothetical protein